MFERKIAMENEVTVTRRELKEAREDLEASEAEVGLVRTAHGATQPEPEELRAPREYEGVAVQVAKEAEVRVVELH